MLLRFYSRGPSIAPVLIHLFGALCASASIAGAQDVVLEIDEIASPTIRFAAESLEKELNDLGHNCRILNSGESNPGRGRSILIGSKEDMLLEGLKIGLGDESQEGAYEITSSGNDTLIIVGSTPEGAIYGCLEAAERARAGQLFTDRGFVTIESHNNPSLGIRAFQASIPEGLSLNRKDAPWFFDSTRWNTILTSMGRWRFNVLILDNLELAMISQESVHSILRSVETEAGKRAISLVLGFRTPKSGFTQEAISALSEFLESHPTIGLNLDFTNAHDSDLFENHVAKTSSESPPRRLIIKVDPSSEVAPPSTDDEFRVNTYSELGLGLFTAPPILGTSEKSLLDRSPEHVIGIPVLGTIAPYQWMNSEIARKTVSMIQENGGQGIVLPPLSPFTFPYSNNDVESRTFVTEHGWLWYAVWSRYAWDPNRDPMQENLFWESLLSARFGMTKPSRDLRQALETSSELILRAARLFCLGPGTTANYLLGAPWERVAYQSKPWPEGVNALPIHLYVKADDDKSGEKKASDEGEPETSSTDEPSTADSKNARTRVDSESSELTRLGVDVASKMENAGRGVTLRRDEFNALARDIDVVRRVGYFWGAWGLSVGHGLSYLEDGDDAHLKLVTFSASQAHIAIDHAALLANRTLDAASAPEVQFPYPSAHHLRDVVGKYSVELKRLESNIAKLSNSETDPYIRKLISHRIACDLETELTSVPAGGSPGSWLVFDVALVRAHERAQFQVKVIADDREQLIQPIVATKTSWQGYALFMGNLAGQEVIVQFSKTTMDQNSEFLLSKPQIMSGVLPQLMGSWVPPDTAEVVASLELGPSRAFGWNIADDHARLSLRIAPQDTQLWPMEFSGKLLSADEIETLVGAADAIADR